MAEIQTIRVYVLTDEDGVIRLEWYIEWQDKTGALASARGCSGPLFDPNFTCPTEQQMQDGHMGDGTGANPQHTPLTQAQRDAYAENNKLYNLLVISTGGTPGIIVRNAKTADLPKGDARLAIRNLSDKYCGRDEVRKLAMEKRYLNTKLRDGKTDPTRSSAV